MPLSAGARLGPYHIVSRLGAGGMGEVFKARDTRLERTVAIKVLGPRPAGDPSLEQRFEREARAVAGLHHPHICVLHDVGQDQETRYLVMEYLEGQTLAERLSKGPLTLEQSIHYAVQIADALDTAHRHGIVHRDLKPANIMLTRSGAKLLDFGLAKLDYPPESTSVLSSVATHTPDLTAQGTILGTLLYMAPEQLEGKDADARTDIFAFGAVLYEMITGRHPFAGNSQASLIGSILRDQPPSLSENTVIPASIDRIVQTCLSKEPDDRWQTARDLHRELRWAAEEISRPDSLPSATRPVRKVRRRLTWAALLVLLMLLGGIGLAWWPSIPQAAGVIRFTIPAPSGSRFSFAGALGGPVAVSPDGTRLVFVATQSGRRHLWIRSIHSLTAEPIRGTDGATRPFWSADGRLIAFASSGKLLVIEAGGGPPRQLAELSVLVGGSWSRHGDIIYAPGSNHSLLRISADGSGPEPVTSLDEPRGETSHRWPFFLPDGRHFLFTCRASKPENSGIFLASLDGSVRKHLLSDLSNAVYAWPGYLLFVREHKLLAQPFDLRKLELRDQPVLIAEGIEYDDIGVRGIFSASEQGLLSFLSAAASELVWLDERGKEIDRLGLEGDFPALSPDESRVAFTRSQNGNPDIWVLDLLRGVSSRLTLEHSMDMYPTWSPNGSEIAYTSNRAGAFSIYRRASSGAGRLELMAELTNAYPLDWSSNGHFLLAQLISPETLGDLWVVPLRGGQAAYPLLQTPFDEDQAQWSPDSGWLAYVSDETSVQEVYVQPFPPQGDKWQISTGGGFYPRWSGDGKRLYYISPDLHLYSVSLKLDKGLRVGAPQRLFPIRVSSRESRHAPYAPSKDGRRFLVNQLAEPTDSPLTLIVNWQATLK